MDGERLECESTYYEKEMRTQLVIPEKSAMSQKQKMNIMSNKLVRRMSNICVDKNLEEEKMKVIDHYTNQLKNSGYERRTCREIVVSGILGWTRKIRRRKEEGRDFYRGARSTLKLRMRKKLLDPTNWFMRKETEENNTENKNNMNTTKNNKNE